MNQQRIIRAESDKPQISAPVSGTELNIGSGFEASSFKFNQFGNLMDPIVMVDHYTMTSPTFGEHPHAGMSAVSVLFEDSTGHFNNKDSLGNNIDLEPGDAYWLKAASGALHDEKPTIDSVIHGLQIFVNLPRKNKFDEPDSLHVRNTEIPEIIGDRHRVRVVFGESNGIQGASSPAMPLTILDSYLEPEGSYKHAVEVDQSLFIFAVNGDVSIDIDGESLPLNSQQSIAIHTGSKETTLTLSSMEKSHIVVFQGSPIRERFVQKGPFVMSSSDDLEAVTKAYQEGAFASTKRKSA